MPKPGIAFLALSLNLFMLFSRLFRVNKILKPIDFSMLKSVFIDDFALVIAFDFAAVNFVVLKLKAALTDSKIEENSIFNSSNH